MITQPNTLALTASLKAPTVLAALADFELRATVTAPNLPAVHFNPDELKQEIADFLGVAPALVGFTCDLVDGGEGNTLTTEIKIYCQPGVSLSQAQAETLCSDHRPKKTIPEKARSDQLAIARDLADNAGIGLPGSTTTLIGAGAVAVANGATLTLGAVLLATNQIAMPFVIFKNAAAGKTLGHSSTGSDLKFWLESTGTPYEHLFKVRNNAGVDTEIYYAWFKLELNI